MPAAFRRITAILVLSALTGCAGQPAAQAPTDAATPSIAATSVATTTAPAPETAGANLTDSCVSDYDPEVDYFPAKVTLSEAEGFTVEYFKNYKLVTVLTPSPSATEPVRYVLVQCGTPAPADPALADAQVIEVPVKRFVAMTSTEIPHLDRLGVLDRLIGVNSAKSISSPAVRERLANGTIKEVGTGDKVNVEQTIDLSPDLIMTAATGDESHDAHPKLIGAGLKVVFEAAWLEGGPLGRAEWIKYVSLFFNQEAPAEQAFAETAERYTALAEQASAVTTRPTVLTGFTYKGTWYVSGGGSYVAQMLADAGADYLWADDDSTGNLQLSFEAVYERAQNADFWLNGSFSWTTLADVTATDERYSQFAAFQQGTIYNNNARLNENGGNDYWESGVANPDVVLADLITIFHPELLPDHKLSYYRKLAP